MTLGIVCASQDSKLWMFLVHPMRFISCPMIFPPEFISTIGSCYPGYLQAAAAVATIYSYNASANM